MRMFYFFLCTLTVGVSLTHAQLMINGAFHSRYIWRGIECGNSPTFFPSMTYTTGNFSMGIVGAYGLSNSTTAYSENDFWVEYRIPFKDGTLSFLCTDLYFPYLGKKFFDFTSTGNGAHTIELGIQYTMRVPLLLTLRAFRTVYNDPQYSSYIEAEFVAPIGTGDIRISSGCSLNSSTLYGTSKASLLHISIGTMRTIEVTPAFPLQLSVSWIINTYVEQSYVVIGIGI
ncbi:MAG: hypothetical protein N3A63_09930 [Bacteroidetes bacterium]|nr:hypothetical protein [Bacteroidota bacterium]